MLADSGGQLLCGIGFTGFAGFCLLLYVALRMWRDEQARKGGGTPRSGAAGTAQTSQPSWLASLLGGKASSPAASAAPAAEPRSGAAGTPASQPADAHEVLRVLRDNLSGRLIVEIGGKRYAKIGEIQDATIGQGFLTTLRDLSRFAGGFSTAPAGPPTPQAPQPQAEAAPRAAPQPQPRAEPPPSVQPAASAEPLRKPSMNPFKQMQVLREMEKNLPAAPKSITEQIDEVLQAKIAGTPLARRGMRVRAGVGGSAAFDLDGKAYDAVDNIPDPDARDVIRAAIKEWEKKQ